MCCPALEVLGETDDSESARLADCRRVVLEAEFGIVALFVGFRTLSVSSSAVLGSERA